MRVTLCTYLNKFTNDKKKNTHSSKQLLVLIMQHRNEQIIFKVQFREYRNRSRLIQISTVLMIAQSSMLLRSCLVPVVQTQVHRLSRALPLTSVVVLLLVYFFIIGQFNLVILTPSILF